MVDTSIARTNKNANGAKALGAVVAIVAVIMGVYAMVEPMSQRIDFLERQLDKIDARLHDTDQRERDAAESLAAIQERFQEVETQFRAERELRTTNEARADKDLDESPTRLRELERLVWGNNAKE